MGTVEHRIEIGHPVRAVYDQWTQFEDWPRFMQGVERIDQLDDARLHWVADIAGVSREFDARIVEQVPDRLIAWRADGETGHAGRVAFEPVGDKGTRVILQMEVEPSGFAERAADALGVIDRRVKGDLERFRDFIESRGEPTGAWRGEIRDGEPTDGATATAEPSTLAGPGELSIVGAGGNPAAASAPPEPGFNEPGGHGEIGTGDGAAGTAGLNEGPASTRSGGGIGNDPQSGSTNPHAGPGPSRPGQ